MDKEIEWSALPQMPHCDPRILHKPEECVFCADAKSLQEERERLGVSNTGHANRAWPCPADKARGSASLNAWGGNQAKTLERLEQEREEWKEALQELTKDH